MANGANPNNNPKCGSKISIRSPTSGQTIQATVVDTCEGCGMYDIDVSDSLFTKVAGGLSAGRVTVGWGAHKPFVFLLLARELCLQRGLTACFQL